MKKTPPPQQKMSGSKPTGAKRGRISKPNKDAQTSVRMKQERVRTAKGRKLSSTRWLSRQLNDPYVKQSKIDGYRSRAAYKLKELDEKFGLLRPSQIVVDLGAAPGGWSQVARESQAEKILGIDILPIEPMADAEFIEMDFMDEKAPEVLITHLGQKADLVMSDLAANTTGHRQTDHLRTIALVEAAADFAFMVLKPEGMFVTKVFQGGAQKHLLERLKVNFKRVRHAKPKSSRAGSPEIYLVAQGFRPNS